jgi:hypothetical protein
MFYTLASLGSDMENIAVNPFGLYFKAVNISTGIIERQRHGKAT